MSTSALLLAELNREVPLVGLDAATGKLQIDLAALLGRSGPATKIEDLSDDVFTEILFALLKRTGAAEDAIAPSVEPGSRIKSISVAESSSLQTQPNGKPATTSQATLRVLRPVTFEPIEAVRM